MVDCVHSFLCNVTSRIVSRSLTILCVSGVAVHLSVTELRLELGRAVLECQVVPLDIKLGPAVKLVTVPLPRVDAVHVHI